MIDDIYVFDDIIEKPYQELIKQTLMGGDKPPTIDEPEEPFPGTTYQILQILITSPHFKEGLGLLISMLLQKME